MFPSGVYKMVTMCGIRMVRRGSLVVGLPVTCRLLLEVWLVVEVGLAQGLVATPPGLFGLWWGSALLALIHPANSTE